MQNTWLASYVALWILVLILCVLFLGLAREIGTLHRRIGAPGALLTDEGLDIGARVAGFTAREVPSGRDIEFRRPTDHETLVVFISPHCGPCRELLPSLTRGWTDWSKVVRPLIVCEGTEQDVQSFAERMKVTFPMLADPLSEIHTSFGRPSTPYAFLLNSEGIVKLKGIVNSRDDIDRLIDGQARLHGGREIVSLPEPRPAAATDVP